MIALMYASAASIRINNNFRKLHSCHLIEIVCLLQVVQAVLATDEKIHAGSLSDIGTAFAINLLTYEIFHEISVTDVISAYLANHVLRIDNDRCTCTSAEFAPVGRHAGASRASALTRRFISSLITWQRSMQVFSCDDIFADL